MVCIIDDRDEVWECAPNLVHVKQYSFFPGTEDINNPYQPHSQDAPSSVYDTTEKAVEAAKQDTVSEETKEHLSIVEHSVEENATEDNTQAKEVVECEQASEQKMSPVVEWPDHDDYLVRLQQILSDIHREYFSRLDAMTELSSSSTSEQQQPQLPSLRDVMPSLRSKVLAGCVLVFSGVFPLHMPLERSKAFQIATSLGAVVQSELQFAHNSSKKDRRRKLKPHKASSSRKRAKHTDDKASRDEIGADSSSNSDVAVAEEGLMGADSGATTHLVAARANTSKWRAARRAGISVVNPKWLWACHYRWERVPEHLFSLSNAAADDDDDVGEADGGGGDKRKLSTDMRRMKQREERQFAKLRHEAKRAAREEERQLAAALPPPARFDLADHPLLRMSRDDLEDMEEEVNAAQGTDNSDSNDSSDSSGADGKRDRELRQAVLSSSPSLSGGGTVDTNEAEDNSVDTAITVEGYPEGWAPKLRRRHVDVEAAVQQDAERDWGEGFAHEGYDYGDVERRFRALSDSASSTSGSDDVEADDVGDDTLDALRDFM